MDIIRATLGAVLAVSTLGANLMGAPAQGASPATKSAALTQPWSVFAAGKNSRWGTLRVRVTGTGKYWVTGHPFQSSRVTYRKSFNRSVTLKVKPGMYEVVSDQENGTHALFKSVRVQASSSKTVEFRMLSATRVSRLASEHLPTWSPDGTRLAFLGFTGRKDYEGAWYVRDLGTGEVVRISDEGQSVSVSNGGASWSPDGTKLVFAMGSPVDEWLIDYYVRDLTTGELQIISTDSEGNRVSSSGTTSVGPRWSPDGTRIAFVSSAPELVPNDTNRAGDVFVKDLRDGSIQRASTSSAGAQANDSSGDTSDHPTSFGFGNLSWSPDGARLAFVSKATNLAPGPQSQYSVFIKNLTSGETDLLNPPKIRGNRGDRSTWSPAWSPDGTRVAFMAYRARKSDFELYVQDLNSGRNRLVGRRLFSAGPAWAPDSRRLSFTRNDNKVVVVDTETGSRRYFPTGTMTAEGYAPWSPNGEQLAVTVPKRIGEGRYWGSYVFMTSEFLKRAR